MTEHKDKNGNCKASRPALVAVTGGIGSGKSLVCRYLSEKGLFVLSADELSRMAVVPGTGAYDKIVDFFGDAVLLSDKTINRPMLRRIISTDPEAKKTLEGFIHPEVFRQMAAQIDIATQRGEPLVVVEVPLLFEAGLESWFDCVVLVSVARERRIERIMARDGVYREDAEAMMKIQMPEREKRSRCDFVIDNNDTEAVTRRSTEALYAYLVGRKYQKKNENG